MKSQTELSENFELPEDRHKPVQHGGAVNHIEMLIICLLTAPFSACTLLIFGEQIDQFFQAWERQLIFVMVICTGFGLWWLTWRLKKF